MYKPFIRIWQDYEIWVVGLTPFFFTACPWPMIIGPMFTQTKSNTPHHNWFKKGHSNWLLIENKRRTWVFTMDVPVTWLFHLFLLYELLQRLLKESKLSDPSHYTGTEQLVLSLSPYCWKPSKENMTSSLGLSYVTGPRIDMQCTTLEPQSEVYKVWNENCPCNWRERQEVSIVDRQ